MSNSTKTQNAFQTWKFNLDQICMRFYVIDTSDMGFDEDHLMHLWSQNDTPEEIAEYFGIKFNLTHASEVMLGG